MSNSTVENLVIIGSGPAGYTAAIYAARANLKPILFEGFQAGGIPGGQLMTTTEVENFPGFPDGLTGPKLMDNMKAQAIRWGAQTYQEDVIKVDFSSRPFLICSAEREVKAHSVIIATGATAKRLRLPSEDQYWSNGISACGICDGASPIFRDQEVAVVGGGDSALEEAIYLTKYSPKVHLLVRRDGMRASKTMQDRVLKNPRIVIHWNSQPLDIFGENGRLTGIKLKDTKSGEERELFVKGLFYAIGHTPNTKLFEGQLELDDLGYIKVKPGTVATNMEGVFAAGDVQDHEYRQAITAAGTGCMAALSAERYLSAHGLMIEHHHNPSPSSQSSTTETVTSAPSTPETFDLNATRHIGGYALRKIFHEGDRLLMVKYVSPTCGPCRTLKPILDKVVDEYEGKIYFVEIDIDAEPEIADMGQVVGTPTVQIFKNQEMIKEFRGIKQKSEYRQVIDQYL